MANAYSPLRYPGGKQILGHVLSNVLKLNKCEGGTYAEPYAGGAGAALALLFGEHVTNIMLNDADTSIYAFWTAVLNQTNALLRLLNDTPLTVDEWDRQRRIYLHPERYSSLRLGFATFYLNRCNRSGIIANGGVIGGRDQSGRWKIDARFNRKGLTRRIERIALYRDRIKLFNLDAIHFLRKHLRTDNTAKRTLVYLDPPYFAKGSQLYLNYYEPDDHRCLSKYLTGEASFLWVMTYDNTPAIRKLYSKFRQVPMHLDYSATERRRGKEVVILHKKLIFPDQWKSKIPSAFLTTADEITTRMS